MCSFALLLVLPVFLRLRLYDSDHDQNVIAARERLNGLNARIAADEIDQTAAAEYEQEIKNQLITEVEDSLPKISANTGRDMLGIVFVVLALVVIAPVLYVMLGTPAALVAPTNMTEMIRQLELRVARSPDDLSSLLSLARMLAAHDRGSEALAYYGRIRKLSDDVPDLLAEHANLLLQHTPDEPEITILLKKGLTIAPQHPILLWLAGIHAENHGDHAEALAYWRRSHDGLPGNPQQPMVAEAIAKVKQQLADSGLSAMTDGNEEMAASGVSVTVSLDEGINTSPDMTLFVFAKAVEGPAMPLAAYRGVAEDLPLTVHLDDRLAMMPAMKMSNFDVYNITARLSSTGDVSARSGDWFGTVMAESGDIITLSISQKIP